MQSPRRETRSPFGVNVPDITNDGRRRQVGATFARLRRTKVWSRSLARLSKLCLARGYTRPCESSSRPWGDQGVVPPPGSDELPDVAEIGDMRQQINAAMAEEHPFYRPDHALADDLIIAAQWVCDHRTDVAGAREQRCTELDRVARDLQGWSTELYKAAPPNVAAAARPAIHVAFVACLAEAMGWPDSLLVEQCVLGCPPVSDIADSGVFVASDEPAAFSLDDRPRAVA